MIQFPNNKIETGSVKGSTPINSTGPADNLKNINRKDQPETDVFESKNKAKEKSFLEKHHIILGAAGMAVGPMIAFGGLAAGVLAGSALMMPLIVAGGIIGIAGFLTSVTDGFAKK